jgi:hypothetical protein
MIKIQKQKFLANYIAGIVFILSIVGVLFSSVTTSALVIPKNENNRVLLQGGGAILPPMDPALPPNTQLPDVNPDFLKPLRPDLPADKALDRLNLLFVYSDEIPDAQLIDYTNFISSTIDKTQVPSSSMERGFLLTEPIRSNRNKINLWNYSQKINIAKYSNFLSQIASYNNLLGIKYIVPIFIRPELITLDPLNTSDGRSNADLPILDYSVDHKILKYYPGKVNELFMRGKEGPNFDKSLALTLTHELGHAIFNLLDEYGESGRTLPLTSFPNCAPDITTARAWWGDLEGQTDPYIKEIFEIQNPRAVFESSIAYNPLTYTYENYVQEYLNIYKVGYYTGGCFAEYTANETQTRPLTASLMSNYYYNPFFGLVNSREITKVFNLFSGTSQVTSKPLPFGINVNNFQYSSESIFEKANCKVALLENAKKTLHCEFKTKVSRSISESPEFALKIVDYSLDYIGDKVALSQSNCKVQNNTVNCSDLDVSNLDFLKKTNLMWKFENSSNYLYTQNMSLDVDTNSQYNKLASFPIVDKAKPTIKITDPYTCGGKITGNVSDNLGVGNVKSVTVTLIKSGESTPRYTFNPSIDASGNYSIAVQQTNKNDTSTYVEPGDYTVTYFATDIGDNVSLPGTYNASIKSKEVCDAKPPTTNSLATISPVLIRSGGVQLTGAVLLMLFLASIAITKTIINRKKRM